MISSMPGKPTSGVEVTDIGSDGIRLLCRGEEMFLSYEHFPWFEGKSRKQVTVVREDSPGHFHWPGLDVDIDLDSIRHPEKYPLVARQG